MRVWLNLLIETEISTRSHFEKNVDGLHLMVTDIQSINCKWRTEKKQMNNVLHTTYVCKRHICVHLCKWRFSKLNGKMESEDQRATSMTKTILRWSHLFKYSK